MISSEFYVVSSRSDLLTNFLSSTLGQSPDPSSSKLTDRALPRNDFGLRLIKPKIFPTQMLLFLPSLRFDLNVANAFANCVSSDLKSATILICSAHILQGRQDSLCIKCITIHSSYRHKPDLITRT